MSLESEIKKFINTTLNNNPNSRQVAMAMELRAGLNDYYAEIQEVIENGKVKFDLSVTVAVDGQKIKFDNIEKVAEWITTL